MADKQSASQQPSASSTQAELPSKKKSSKKGADDPLLKGHDKQISDVVSIQAYAQNLTEQLARYKHKCEVLLNENLTLGNMQSKFSQDRQDIVEFLNIKVQEHEKHITALELQIQGLEGEKAVLELSSNAKLLALSDVKAIEIDQMHIQCAKYKTDLDQLSEFRGRKEDMEVQIRLLKSTLDTREREYRDIIHTMERKILQDKNVMKKEMLQKVNEAVANFRRVADQQMAETTKRAIRENMAITAQLKKMSSKTIELLSDNENLVQKVKKLKIDNSLLIDSEKDLARKNQANQRVIKMLVEKIKESDRMIEIAYDAGAIGSPLVEDSVQLVESSAPIIIATSFQIDDGAHAVKHLQNAESFKIAGEIKALVQKKGDDLDMRIIEYLKRFSMKFAGSANPFSSTLSAPPLAQKSANISDKQENQVQALQDQEPQQYQSISKPVSSRIQVSSKRLMPLTASPTLNTIISHTRTHSAISNSTASSIPLTRKSVSSQTSPLKFSPHFTPSLPHTTPPLLYPLRPWGPPAHCMPRKIGLYCPTSGPVIENPAYYYPKIVYGDESGICCGANDSTTALFGPTDSTTMLFSGSSDTFE